MGKRKRRKHQYLLMGKSWEVADKFNNSFTCSPSVFQHTAVTEDHKVKEDEEEDEGGLSNILYGDDEECQTLKVHARNMHQDHARTTRITDGKLQYHGKKSEDRCSNSRMER